MDDNSDKIRHSYKNVITCCKHCNFAKCDLSIEEFFIWIDRIKNNYENLISLINLLSIRVA
jgi:uncharacterized protein YeeX (DUF496 family)